MASKLKSVPEEKKSSVYSSSISSQNAKRMSSKRQSNGGMQLRSTSKPKDQVPTPLKPIRDSQPLNKSGSKTSDIATGEQKETSKSERPASPGTLPSLARLSSRTSSASNA